MRTKEKMRPLFALRKWLTKKGEYPPSLDCVRDLLCVCNEEEKKRLYAMAAKELNIKLIGST